MMPNPSFEARPNIKKQGLRGGAGLSSTAQALSFAVGPASIQTLVPTEHRFSHASTRLAQVGSPLSSPLAFPSITNRP
jgi:hypothetical protein